MTPQEETLSRQDDFLDNLIAGKDTVSVFLINGIRLAGSIRAYDRHVVLLEAQAGSQLIYKHAISTVLPNGGAAAPRRAEPSVDKSTRSGLYRRDA